MSAQQEEEEEAPALHSATAGCALPSILIEGPNQVP
jgi:hypothetical protein